MTFTEQAIEILQQTNDGDDLVPPDLYLLECVVNASPYGVSEATEVAFSDMYTRVTSGTYRAPWFHGQEGLTQDHNGYVYWRGARVEHYSFRDATKEKQAATRLADLCRRVEARGEDVTFSAICKEAGI